MLVFFLFPLTATAGFYYQHSLYYNSSSDNVENFSYSTLRNTAFLGASLGKSDRIILGQNIIMWNQARDGGEGGSESTLDLLELGPRLSFFFDEGRTCSATLSYHPYVKGTRKYGSAGAAENVSGTSYLVNLSYQFKVSKTLFLGASLNYHGVSLATATVNNVESTLSHSYTNIYPALEFSLRF